MKSLSSLVAENLIFFIFLGGYFNSAASVVIRPTALVQEKSERVIAAIQLPLKVRSVKGKKLEDKGRLGGLFFEIEHDAFPH